MKERVRHFLYRGKMDQQNFRMRYLRYFLTWANVQAQRLNISVMDIFARLRAGATFETIEGAAPVIREPTVVTQATVNGTGKVGEALTMTAGTYQGEEPINEGYEWLLDGTFAAGGPSYTPVADDVGKAVTVKVIASNVWGRAEYTANGPTVTA